MISIIISSYQAKYFQALEKNIAETCGTEYELIKIDNPGLMAICKAYNIGAAKAKYENLLFVHEDVQFLTSNWGTNLINLLSDEKVGIVGVAGSDYIPNCPSGWHNAGVNNYINIEQYDGSSKFISSSRTEKDQKVYLIDGVFLGLRKNWWNALKFNEAISGFHGYDIDITARSASQKINIVTNKILLRHYSMGKADKKWFFTLLKIRKFYKCPTSQKCDIELETRNFDRFLYGLRQHANRFEVLFYTVLYLNPKYLGSRKSLHVLKSIIWIFIARNNIEKQRNIL